MTTAEMTTTLPTPTATRQPEGAVGIACSVLLERRVQDPEPKCSCGRKAYLIDPLFPYHCELNRCWYHRGGSKWAGREKEYQREYRKANRARINARNRANPKSAERSEAYRKANLEKFREYNRAYRRRHGKRINAARRGHYPPKKYDAAYFENYRKQNRDKLRIISRAQGSRQRAELADTYVRRVLATGLRVPASELPAEAVELNRAIIKIKRILWQNQKT
jgi:hypothetical protein